MPSDITDQDCESWRANPNVNPQTGRRIEVGRDVYRRLERRCNETAVPIARTAAATTATATGTAAAAATESSLLSAFERSVSQVVRANFGDAIANSIGRAAVRSVQRSLRNNVPLPPGELESFAHHLDENTLDRLLSIQQTAPPALTPSERRRLANVASPSSPTPPPAQTVPLVPGQSALAPRANAPPFQMNFQNLLVSRYEVDRYFSRRLQQGLNTIIHPRSGKRILLNTEVLAGNGRQSIVLRNEVFGACQHFGLPTERGPNAMEFVTTAIIRPSGPRMSDSSAISVDNLDKYVAEEVRLNGFIVNPVTSRRITRSTTSLIYLDLIRMAYVANLDLDHFNARTTPDQPQMEAPVEAPVESHAAHVAQLIQLQIVTRFGIFPQSASRPATARTGPTPRARASARQDIANGLNSIPKTALLSTLTSPTDVHISCISTLNNIPPPFKTLGNKLRVLCTKLSKECQSLNTTHERLLKTVKQASSPTSKSFLMIEPENVIASMFKIWSTRNEAFRTSWFLISPKQLQESMGYFSVMYIRQNGIGPGVVKSAIQQGMEEISRLGFFVKYDEPNGRAFVNPNLALSDDFKRIAGIRQEADYVSLYEFIGNFIMFMMIFSTGLPFSLSHAILAHMLYKHEDITNDDYIAYSMMDFPAEFAGLANLLRTPENIEHAYLSFNSEYDLRPQDDDVDIGNFREYLAVRSKQRALHTLYPRDTPRAAPGPGPSADTYERFMGLVRGLSPMRKLLRHERVSIPMLDKFLTSQTISPATVMDLRENFQRSMRARSAIEVKVTDTMSEILSDMGERFPYEARGMERPSTSKDRQVVFLDFIERLLMFWSSLKSYSNNMHYVVRVKSRAQYSSTRRYTDREFENMFPESHTCMTLIDIPESIHDNFEVLYTRLVLACYNVEAGMGNLGGALPPVRKNKSKKPSKSTKSSKSSKSTKSTKSTKSHA